MKTKGFINFCDKVIELSLYGLALAIPFSKACVETLATVAIISWVLKRIFVRDYSIPRSTASIPLLLFLGLGLLSFINSKHIYLSVRGFGKIAEWAALYFVVIDTVKSARVLRNLIIATLVSVFVVCLDGLYQYVVGHDLIRNQVFDNIAVNTRMTGPFKSANDLAGYLLTTLPIYIALIVKIRPKGILSVASFGLLAVGLLCMMLTYSRGGWIGLFVGILILGFFLEKKIIAAVLVAGVIFPFIAPSSFTSTASEIFNLNSITTQERLQYWKVTFEMIKEHPIIGNGLNTFCANYARFDKFKSGTTPYAHNCYLQMAAEVGVLGLISFMFMLFFAFLRSLPKLTNEKNIYSALSIGIFAGLCGFLVQSTVDTNLYALQLAALFWVSLGLLWVSKNLSASAQ